MKVRNQVLKKRRNGRKNKLLFDTKQYLVTKPSTFKAATTTTHLKNRLTFPPNLFSYSKRALLCTSESNSESTVPFVLSSLLYYVNAPPHMGSAYTTIAADAIARFQRLLGKKVIFITGTDEHGEKIAAAAAASSSSPDIAYDKFISTTDPKHEAVVKEFYSRVLANCDIYKADYEDLFCVNCEEYKDEKDLLENHCCPIHLKPCLVRKKG